MIINQPRWYCPSSSLDSEDQKWIYFHLLNDNYKERLNNGLMINGECINGSCKPEVNAKQTLSYLDAISSLKAFSYNTPPVEISKLLEELFGTAKEGHWLWIAQRWCPRPIIQVLTSMVKEIEYGQIKIKNPAAYFTYLIRFRKRRRRARGRRK